MAKLKLSYNCGCGYRTTSLEEAKLHSDSNNHNLSVIGTVSQEQKKKEG